MGTLCREDYVLPPPTPPNPLQKTLLALTACRSGLRRGFCKGMTDRKASNHGLLGLRLFFFPSFLFFFFYQNVLFDAIYP